MSVGIIFLTTGQADDAERNSTDKELEISPLLMILRFNRFFVSLMLEYLFNVVVGTLNLNLEIMPPQWFLNQDFDKSTLNS